MIGSAVVSIDGLRGIRDALHDDRLARLREDSFSRVSVRIRSVRGSQYIEQTVAMQVNLEGVSISRLLRNGKRVGMYSSNPTRHWIMYAT